MNIFRNAFKHISFLKELSIENFSKKDDPTYQSAKLILDKDAVLYYILGTNIILSAHSDQFKSTPNSCLWYIILESDDKKIKLIAPIDKEVVLSHVDEELMAEIEFYANLCISGLTNKAAQENGE